MKTLQSLFISLFTILLIASCDSSTSPDTREGQRIGTWMVYSNSADWVGTQSQSKFKSASMQSVDTLYYEQPDSISMSMFRLSEWTPNAAGFQLVDSTFNPEDIYIRMINPLQENRVSDIGAKRGLGYVDYRTSAFVVDCDSTYSSNEHIIISYKDKKESNFYETLKVYKINTTGVVDAAKTMAGCYN